MTIQFRAKQGEVSAQLDFAQPTVLVSPDWEGPSFLGWTGFLERLRFAVDPSQNRQHFYFGSVAA